jgi:signal transduction histidine kinase
MNRASSRRHLVADIKAPLAGALRLLRPHQREIRAEWHRKVRGLGLIEQEIEAISRATFDADSGLLSSNLESFQEHFESEALVLEAKGVAEEQLIVGMGAYLECCLPYLFAAGQKGKAPAIAVVRLVAAVQGALLRSYAGNREAALRRVQERERHNLSRDLHDDIGHNLLVLKLYLEMMSMDLNRGDVAQLGSKLQEALALVLHAVDSVRRLMLDLGPAMLSQFGFLRAIRIYARQFSLRTGIDVKVEAAEAPERLGPGQETALYRVVQGALSNVLQHAQAKHVSLKVHATRRLLMMSIEDDGTGFDVTGTLPQRAFGIRAMRERVELLGGRFHIASTPARAGGRRHGTRIEIDLPLGEDRSEGG